jgi:hypothetical protein
MSVNIERSLTFLQKEHHPDIEVTTLLGEYILKFGGVEVERWEAGDVTTAKIMQGWIRRKMNIGYAPKDYPL